MAENISLENLSDCGSSFRIYQDKSKFCFGIDAILLADFAKNMRGKKICDLCTGNGIIPILLAEKTKAEEIHGLELQVDVARLATESVKLNKLENRIKIFTGNLKDVAAILEKNTYDAVTVNPPYMKANSKTPESSKSIARQELYCNLEDVIKAAAKLLKSNGKLFMIHRPERIAEIFVLLNKYNLGARRLRLIQPDAYKKPTMILIEAEKCSRADPVTESTLIIYREKGIYTEEINRIYGRNC